MKKWTFFVLALVGFFSWVTVIEARNPRREDLKTVPSSRPKIPAEGPLEGGLSYPTCQLTATTTDECGRAYELNWSTEHARTVRLSDGARDLSASFSDSISVRPTTSTTYTLTAEGFLGTCSYSLILNPNSIPPRCSLRDTVLEHGHTLSWDSSCATSVEFREESRVISTSAAGTHRPSLEGPTNYLLRVTNSAGSCERAITLSP